MLPTTLVSDDIIIDNNTVTFSGNELIEILISTQKEIMRGEELNQDLNIKLYRMIKDFADDEINNLIDA